MGKDIFFYSITVDSKHDTPAVLKAYAKRFHTGPGWYFLTGKKEDIDTVRKKIGMAGRLDEDPLTGHTSSLTLGNEPQGQWMQDSSFDDPHFIATIVGNWLTPGYRKASNSYENVPRLMNLWAVKARRCSARVAPLATPLAAVMALARTCLASQQLMVATG